MTDDRRPVTVAVDGRPETALAVRWAAAEARSRKVPLRIVHAYEFPPAYGPVPTFAVGSDYDPYAVAAGAKEIVAEAVEEARGELADCSATSPVIGEAVEGHRVGMLLETSRRSAVLVLGSRRLGPVGGTVLGSVGSAVAARAHCPVVVVRGPSGLPDQGARVVAGLDGSELSEDVLAYAFEHASRCGVPLRAVMCWHSGPISRARRSEEAASELRSRYALALSEALAGWREKYPEVSVERHLVEQHAVAGLVEEARNASLLVVGAHGRHAFAGTFLGSVSQGVLHHADCPVAVLHAEPAEASQGG